MGVMIFAQHPALHSIASLSVIGILSILFISFTIQPVIFEALIVGQKQKRTRPLHPAQQYRNTRSLPLFCERAA